MKMSDEGCDEMGIGCGRKVLLRIERLSCGSGLTKLLISHIHLGNSQMIDWKLTILFDIYLEIWYYLKNKKIISIKVEMKGGERWRDG
jgi:hypothetical protein